MSEIYVCLTFDFDAESAQIRKEEDQVRISKGQFAVQRGLSRVLALLAKYEIKSTFFVCGWVAEKYPQHINEITSAQHEIAAHGYFHEYLDKLEFNEEIIVHEHTNQVLEGMVGKIKGFRAPYWKMSKNTLTIISEMGYMYDSSLMDEDRPYVYSVPESPKNLVEFPVEWFLDDWVLFEHHQKTPSEVFEIWKAQFDALLEMEDLEENRKVLTLTFHPSCIGHAYRINVLDRLIRYMKSKQTTFVKMIDLASDYLL
ncbi:MAG: polysaccharide deacetylase family protein [Candidatus Heimdallarchaeota archaeon]|nr:polysaccharide deacetylase family protein [Candidatus Heimdallarchaeota archaeon]